ncbi:MAG: VRR-NUC domain-containing protein, partial [Proteobacteria bacterium]|nr:VRR-NUC domain-containing protein [Pseudomonadota bacterium]
MRKLESKLQSACVKWFDDKISPTQAFLFSVPNGGSRHKLEAYNLKLEGLKVGIADLVLILAGGTTIFIELKYDK